MAQALHVDLDGLRAQGAAFEEIGDAMRATVERLRAGLAAEGKPWGDDEPGRAFERGYLPNSEQGMAGLAQTAETLREFGKRMRTTAGNFEGEDFAGGEEIDALDNQFPANASPSMVPSPESVSDTGDVVTADPVGEGSGQTGYGAARPQLPTAPNFDTSASNQSRDTSSSPRGQSAGAAATPVDRRVPGAGARLLGPTPWREQQRVSAAQDRRPSTNPWSKSGMSADQSSTPPRPTANSSQRPRRHGTDDRRGRTNMSKSDGLSGTAAGREDSGSVTELARMLADRHGLEVIGFETSGLDLVTVREFVSAVDDVLSTYPMLRLRCVGIGVLGPESTVISVQPSRTSRDDTSQPSAWSIILDADAAREPHRHAEGFREVLQGLLSVVAGADQRPIYSSAVLSLGRALDVGACGAARQRAERALIAEYLFVHGGGYRRLGLGRVVSDYRRWRGPLCGSAYGSLDPGRALATAFTDVVLNRACAAEPAKALHRLLVETARQALTPATTEDRSG
ncbi:hypothetical protein [Nocardia sp. NPDC050793]|uniref:hypothetical protein n=1 Tax=Nocardia sp. NPDC050793 TaxID=3155159 RepID=UPI0033EA99F9